MEKNIEAGNNKYGNHRLKLAVFLRDKILPLIKNTNFIENGTLLGAWRNKKFINHDDDFDFGILIDDMTEIKVIFDIIKNNISKCYHCRLIENYSHKIEVYDPAFGKFTLTGNGYYNSDFHYVTLDLQFYLKQDNIYKCLYYRYPQKKIEKNIIIPTQKIELESELFNCPNNIEKFLKINYGCLDKNVKYCEKTGMYFPKRDF